jgi:hypothetical protein
VWLRLVVSASVAIVLLMAAITFGMRTLRGVGPIGGVTTSEPEPVGIPLHPTHDVALARFTQRDVEALREYLTTSPGDRLAAALAGEDTRFLGVSGLAMDVPSVDDAARAVREGRVRSIPGTTDAAISEEHAELIARARRYAAAYNALLLSRSDAR